MSQMPAGFLSTRQLKAAVKQQIRRGCRGSQVAAELVRRGADPGAAESLVRETLHAARSSAGMVTIIGVVLTVLGIGVTLGSYAAAYESAARSGGGFFVYYVWFGAVIVGGILAIVGLARLATYRW